MKLQRRRVSRVARVDYVPGAGVLDHGVLLLSICTVAATPPNRRSSSSNPDLPRRAVIGDPNLITNPGASVAEPDGNQPYSFPTPIVVDRATSSEYAAHRGSEDCRSLHDRVRSRGGLDRAWAHRAAGPSQRGLAPSPDRIPA